MKPASSHHVSSMCVQLDKVKSVAAACRLLVLNCRNASLSQKLEKNDRACGAALRLESIRVLQKERRRRPNNILQDERVDCRRDDANVRERVVVPPRLKIHHVRPQLLCIHLQHAHRAAEQAPPICTEHDAQEMPMLVERASGDQRAPIKERMPPLQITRS